MIVKPSNNRFNINDRNSSNFPAVDLLADSMAVAAEEKPAISMTLQITCWNYGCNLQMGP
jgi:hypothetical protein